MAAYNDILRTVPTIQAAGMVGHNVKFLKKKKKKVKDIVELGAFNITGSALIDAEGEFL